MQPTGWGPYYLYTRNTHWIPAGNRVLEDYFPRRTDVVLEQFISRGLYPGVAAPTFHVDGVPQHGGQVVPGSMLSMQAPSGVIWYTLDGQDPRRPAQAARVVAVHTLVAEDAAKRVLVPEREIDNSWKGGAPFNDSSWTALTGAPGGVGYEQSAGYESLIGLDVNDLMFGKNRSCYIRIPFHLDVDPARFGHMMLRIRSDDGFVAYLNGREMLRVRFQGTPTWDCGSYGTHEADDAELFVVSRSLPLLRRGDNVLAIHGMNSATDSFDFLILASLEAVESTADRDSGLSGAAIRYDGPVILDRTAHVRARVLERRKLERTDRGGLHHPARRRTMTRVNEWACSPACPSSPSASSTGPGIPRPSWASSPPCVPPLPGPWRILIVSIPFHFHARHGHRQKTTVTPSPWRTGGSSHHTSWCVIDGIGVRRHLAFIDENQSQSRIRNDLASFLDVRALDALDLRVANGVHGEHDGVGEHLARAPRWDTGRCPISFI